MPCIPARTPFWSFLLCALRGGSQRFGVWGLGLRGKGLGFRAQVLGPWFVLEGSLPVNITMVPSARLIGQWDSEAMGGASAGLMLRIKELSLS